MQNLRTQSNDLRVLMTADTIGGVWTYALELARALETQGLQVMLATMGGPLSSRQWEEAEAIPGLQVFESEYKLEWMDEPWRDVKAAGEWLLDLEKRFRPDVIHLNGYAHGALDWSAPTLVVAHSCVLSWWEAVKNESAPISWNTYRREVRRGIRSAGVVVAPSRAMLAQAALHYGPFRNVSVIPNGRAAAMFKRSRKENLIFASGRLWDEAKNLTLLEQAAHQLAWPVYAAGEQNHPDGGVRQIAGVHTIGRISDQRMAEWMAKASIYALPARYEPFGLSILEAALAECALVLGDIESLRENWQGAAVFVPPDDPDALQFELERLIADVSRRKALAVRAHYRALRFTPELMAFRYLVTYADLIAKTHKQQNNQEVMAFCG